MFCVARGRKTSARGRVGATAFWMLATRGDHQPLRHLFGRSARSTLVAQGSVMCTMAHPGCPPFAGKQRFSNHPGGGEGRVLPAGWKAYSKGGAAETTKGMVTPGHGQSSTTIHFPHHPSLLPSGSGNEGQPAGEGLVDKVPEPARTRGPNPHVIEAPPSGARDTNSPAVT